MGRGLPKKYAKMGFKKGWAAYKRTKRKTRTKRRSPVKRRKKAVRRRSSSKLKRKGGSTGRTFHIAPLAGAAAVPGALLLGAFTGQIGGIEAMGKLGAAYTGYDAVAGGWDPGIATANYLSIGIGCGISKLFAKTGFNKLLPKGFNI